MEILPLLRPSLSEEEERAVLNVLRSGWWGQGPVVERFEAEFAAKTGYKYVVAVNSCTAALHLAMILLDVGPGDEVILPALTFISDALVVSYCSAKPVFADVCQGSLTIDWRDVYRKLTPHTRAVIAVDYAGLPAIDQDANFVTAQGIPIVQDAAHSAGGYSYGRIACYSFHPVKNLATGDGGALATDDKDLADRARALRWCGIDKSTHERTKDRYGWNYAIHEVGYKYNWSDLQAAIGLAQLHRLDELNQARRDIAERYDDALWCNENVDLPLDNTHNTWHLYPIRVPAERRDSIISALTGQGISAGVHYKPLTSYPMWEQPTPPVTESEWRRLISLPIFPDMTEAQQQRVIVALLHALTAGTS